MFKKIAVTIVIGIVMVGAAQELTQSDPQASGSAKPLSPAEQGRFLPQQNGPVGAYPLGPITFHIPKGFRPGYYQSGTPDGAGAIMLFALLPDLSPETPENKAEFDQPGWGRKVMISIEYEQGRNSGKDLQKRYEDSLLEKSNSWTEGAYSVRQMASAKGYNDIPGERDYYFANFAKPRFFVCDDHRLGVLKGVTEICEITEARHSQVFKLDKNGRSPFIIDYNFNRIYTKSVNDIDQKIQNLVDGFEISKQTP